jgi:hypothetical protein
MVNTFMKAVLFGLDAKDLILMNAETINGIIQRKKKLSTTVAYAPLISVGLVSGIMVTCTIMSSNPLLSLQS